jgi:enoyl-CoA hydratase
MELGSLETVKVKLADGVAEVVLSRPRALNALNRQVLLELERAFTALEREASLRCVIVTGEGDKAFVAGADIAEMSKLTPAEAEDFARLGHRVFALIERLPVPVLAAVNGYALGGGCELALACDVIYASERAQLGQPEVKLGLIPGFGGTVRLLRKVGLAAASEWIFTGEMISAEQAKAAGLVREVLKPEELLSTVREVAQKIAQRAPLAVRAAKRLLAVGNQADAGTSSQLEQQAFGALFASADMREGTAAFLEKRDPSFKGA